MGPRSVFRGVGFLLYIVNTVADAQQSKSRLRNRFLKSPSPSQTFIESQITNHSSPNSLKATTLLGPSPVLAMPHIQKAASVEDTKEAVRDGTRMPPQQTQTARHCCTCLSTGMHETCNLLPFLDPF